MTTVAAYIPTYTYGLIANTFPFCRFEFRLKVCMKTKTEIVETLYQQNMKGYDDEISDIR